MPCSQQVDFRVRGHYPEAVIFPSEGLHAHPLGHVPDPDALVLRVGHNDVLPRIKRVGQANAAWGSLQSARQGHAKGCAWRA